jgi:hypothetical protein
MVHKSLEVYDIHDHYQAKANHKNTVDVFGYPWNQHIFQLTQPILRLFQSRVSNNEWKYVESGEAKERNDHCSM